MDKTRPMLATEGMLKAHLKLVVWYSLEEMVNIFKDSR